jgi:membrane protein involved in colicin uptake
MDANQQWTIPAALRIAVPEAPITSRRTGVGLWASLLLHLLLAGALLWIARPHHDTPEMPPPISVALVTLGPSTESPKADLRSPVPQQRAEEISERASRDAIPPKTTTASAAHPPAAGGSASAGRKISGKPEAPSKRVAAAPQRDTLSERLQQFASLALPPSTLAPDPNPQSGNGSSNVTASSGKTAGEAVYGVKDFIRAQVMRRWYVADPTPVAKGWTVSIHIKLRRDGTVASADVVDLGRYRADPRYFDFALSARNAVLLSSPLTIPAGGYDLAKELVLEFDPRAVMQ